MAVLLVQVHLRQVVDEGHRRGVGHVADRQLAGEAVGGGRVVGEVGQVRRHDRAAVGVGVRVAEPHDLDRAGPVAAGSYDVAHVVHMATL